MNTSAKPRHAGHTCPTRHQLDELQHLLDGGIWPGEAVVRTGWTSLKAAARAARRHSRHALAHHLEKELDLEKHFQAAS